MATIFQLKVSLLGTKPLIWRRLLVSEDVTLTRLHLVIQMAMGWQNYHLHEFEVGRVRYAIPDHEDFGLPESIDEGKTKLKTVFEGVGAKARYTYDFGDGWEHSIRLEKILPPDPALRYPLCVAGKLHGPPEDCGGVGGYYELLDTIADKEHPDHADMTEWLGTGFDPEHFSLAEVNEALEMLRPSIQKKSRRTSGSIA